jgi:hypothetical protein
MLRHGGSKPPTEITWPEASHTASGVSTAIEYGSDEEFREAVQAEFAMCENIGERLGVAIVAAPMRTRLHPDGEWFTAGWAFKTATVPAGREEPVEQPLPARSSRSSRRWPPCPRTSNPP